MAEPKFRFRRVRLKIKLFKKKKLYDINNNK